MTGLIDRCRSCGHPDLFDVLDLGRMPLATSLLREDDLGRPEPRFPLTLVLCPDCGLVQLRETVGADGATPSGASRERARAIAHLLRRKLELGPDSLVLQIGSGDGSLLQTFVSENVPVLGIEPARHVAQVAIDRGVETIAGSFGLKLAARLRNERRQADAVVASEGLARAGDLNDVAGGIAHVLRPHGCAVVEFPYVGDMIERTAFDAIDHEHLCYFSLSAARRLFERLGLRVLDVERLPPRQGRLRVILGHANAGGEASHPVAALLDEERSRGLTGIAPFARFGERVRKLKIDLRRHLHWRRSVGMSLAAYGACPRGATILNTFRIGPELLEFVVDESTDRHGRYTPGSHLLILPAAALLERRPGAVLLLASNLTEEVIRLQRDYLDTGGEFVVPIPEVRSVTKEALDRSAGSEDIIVR